jgi:hypothetical protein
MGTLPLLSLEYLLVDCQERGRRPQWPPPGSLQSPHTMKSAWCSAELFTPVRVM